MRSKAECARPTSTSVISRHHRPVPGMLRPALRLLLRAWSYFPKATGYMSEIVERWGGRLATRPLECRLSNGMRMTCDLKDHIQRQIYFRGAYEPIEAYLFQLMLRPGMVVIDAGANVGQYTLVAAGVVGPHGQVHAFEPVPTTFQLLVAHVRENGIADTVQTNKMALWHRVETLSLCLGADMVGNAGSYTIGRLSGAVDTVTSSGVPLDDYVTATGLQHVEFIKMDVEGAEWFALQGAVNVISRWRPTMLVEINRHACRLLGYEPEKIWDFLRPYGYLMWAVGESADVCRAISHLDGVDRANIVFHVDQLPDNMLRGWTLKSVLRFHRRPLP